MMIQMHNEISNVIGLDRDLELIWRWLKWNQEKEMEEMVKKVEKSSIVISYEHAENSHSRAKLHIFLIS